MSKFSLPQKAEFRRLIDRQWTPYLTSAEAKVVSFLFTVTVEWGKAEDRVKREHFVYGLGYAQGTGLSFRTVQRALDSLIQDSAILVRSRTPYGYVLALNPNWTPMMLRVPRKNPMTAPKGLRAPKESGQNDHSRVAKMATPVPKRDTIKEHTSCSSAIASNGVASSGNVRKISEARVQETIARGQAKRDLDLAKARSRFDPAALQLIWTRAFRETFPEAAVPVWTRKEQGQAKLFTRTAGTRNGVEVLEWAVRSWRLIVNARFSWMTDGAPDLPTIGFMLAFKDRFYEAWSDKERLRQDITLSGRERRVRRLMHQGLTHEEAQTETKDRDALANERAKLAEERARLDAMLRQADKRPSPTLVQLRQPKKMASGSGPIRPGQAAGVFGRVGDDDF